MPHVYRSPGSYQPNVLADIAGHAEAAAYGRYGNPYLIRRPFSVVIGNTMQLQAVRRGYWPPVVAAAVAPTIDASGVPPADGGFRHVEALRGALTDFYVRLLVERQAEETIDGIRVGWGHSTLTAWRYLGPPTDSGSAAGTPPFAVLGPVQPLRLQWDTPDLVAGSRTQDYAIRVILYLRTVYPDGHVRWDAITSSVSVTVDFTAQAA